MFKHYLENLLCLIIVLTSLTLLIGDFMGLIYSVVLVASGKSVIGGTALFIPAFLVMASGLSILTWQNTH